MKDSIIFYLSQYEAIKTFSNEQLGRLFRAIFENQLKQLENNSKTTPKEVVLEDDIKIAFNFINNQLVIDKNKYEKKCKINQINGKKGGAPKGNKNAQKQPKQPNGVKNNPNDNDNDNENENDNENDNDINNKATTITNSKNLFELIEEIFGRTLNSSECELINTWDDNDLTRYAIKQAELNRVFRVRYIDSILYNYKKDKITTVAEAEEREKYFLEQKHKKKNFKTNYEKNQDIINNFLGGNNE